MPINIQYQPSAAAIGNAAYAAGAENLRRYEEAQAFQQQQLAQQAQMQREQLAAQQYRQNQQLDYNSRAAALGVLANQSSQARQFEQQRFIQDDAQQYGAQQQDQRLQYGYQQLQDQLASRAALQEQSLGAQFARQYLSGQQNLAYQQQAFQNSIASNAIQNMQNLNFENYKLDAQSQAKLNQIRQNRSRLEQMKLNGQINDRQYQFADARIKAQELGLANTLPQQENQDLVSALNNSLVQHSGTGAWMQQDPQTGMWEVVNTQQNQQQDPLELQKTKFKMEMPLKVAELTRQLVSDSYKTENPISVEEGKRRAEMILGLSPSSAPGVNQNPGSSQGGQSSYTIPRGPNGLPRSISEYPNAPVVTSEAEIAQLPPGTVFGWRDKRNALQKTGTQQQLAAGEQQASRPPTYNAGTTTSSVDPRFATIPAQNAPALPTESEVGNFLGVRATRPANFSWGEYFK